MPGPLSLADPWAARVWRRYLDCWHEQCGWEADLAYHDGYTAGYAAANAELVDALRRALGGPHARTWRQAVTVHHRAVDARRRREQFDRAEPCPGEHPGRGGDRG